MDYTQQLTDIQSSLHSLELFFYIVVWSIFVFVAWLCAKFVWRLIMSWVRYLFKFNI